VAYFVVLAAVLLVLQTVSLFSI